MLRTVKASARIEGTREDLFAIITDYGRYATWLPGIEHAGLLAREGDVAIAEFRAPRWSHRTFNIELVHSPEGSVIFRQIDSLGRPDVEGSWKLGETEPGVGAATVLVELEMRVETPLLGRMSRRRPRSATCAGLDALGSRRRHVASAMPAAAARKQKVLEVIRETDGLKVWYLGESYRLPREYGLPREDGP